MIPLSPPSPPLVMGGAPPPILGSPMYQSPSHFIYSCVVIPVRLYLIFDLVVVALRRPVRLHSRLFSPPSAPRPPFMSCLVEP